MASLIIRGLFFGLLFIICTDADSNIDLLHEMHTEPPTEEIITRTQDCIKGGRTVAVKFSNLFISRYVAWFAAALLLIGIIQILVGLFVFLSDGLDFYMLLLNYCLATMFCIFTVIISGSGTVLPLEDTCKFLSPLNCVAISVPLMALFLLSYSRFYAITYPSYHVDRFTILNQVLPRRRKIPFFKVAI